MPRGVTSGIAAPPASQTLRGIEAAEFVARTVPALEAVDGVRIERAGAPRRYTELTGDPEITVSTVESSDPDWFDLGVIVTIDGRRIPFAPLLTALTRRRTKLLLADGRYFSLAHPALDRLRELLDEAATLAEWETSPRINRHQVDLWADFEDLADQAEPAVSWRATAEGLRDVQRIEPTPVPTGLTAELRPYQRAGFDWLAFLWRHRLGGILADDMGLGKTLQMLSLIQHAHETGERRPFLVVAPTSVLSVWRSEAERFAPGLRIETIAATRAKSGRAVGEVAASADVIITSYALLRLDAAEFGGVDWAALVLDEAQFVKNPQTKLHRAARDLRAPMTFAITGTPLENSLTELWALLSLTAPGLFPSARRFREQYVQPIERGKVPENEEGGPYRAARLARLRRRIRPLVLRRTKELVAPELPPKQEQELHIELAPAHRALYDTVLQRERQKVLGLLEDLDRNRFIVFRSLTLLRMLSLAPVLVDPDDAGVPSSKLDELLLQLREIVAEGHRTVVFSQFTSFLELVGRRLDAAGIAHTYLDGSTRHRERVIDEFRTRRGAGVPDQPQGGRLRADPDRGRLRLPARPVVESGGRGAGGRPCAPHRADPHRHGLPDGGRRHDRGEGDGAPAPQGAALPGRARRRRTVRPGTGSRRHPRAARGLSIGFPGASPDRFGTRRVDSRAVRHGRNPCASRVSATPECSSRRRAAASCATP